MCNSEDINIWNGICWVYTESINKKQRIFSCLRRSLLIFYKTKSKNDFIQLTCWLCSQSMIQLNAWMCKEVETCLVAPQQICHGVQQQQTEDVSFF